MDYGRWYIESDNGLIPLSPEYAKKLERAIDQNLKKIIIRENSHEYEVNLIAPLSTSNNSTDTTTSNTNPRSLLRVDFAQQTNTFSGRVRELKRLPHDDYWRWEYDEDGDDCWCEFNNSEFLEWKYNSNGKKIDVAVRDGEKRAKDENEEYESDEEKEDEPNSKRLKLSSDSNETLMTNNTLGDESTIVIQSQLGHILQIDFDSMTQTNLDTGKVCKIRRLRKVPKKEGVRNESKDKYSEIWRELDINGFNDDMKKDLESSTCVICLCDLIIKKKEEEKSSSSKNIASLSSSCNSDVQNQEKQETIVELTGCKGHYFHLECIRQMLAVSDKSDDDSNDIESDENEGNNTIKKNSCSLKCPICKQISGGGPLYGNQPENGTMSTRIWTNNSSNHYNNGTVISGIPKNCKYVQIEYNFPSGIQDSRHPNPGKPYSGTFRMAYVSLEHMEEGEEILKLLKIAFEQRLIFTIGTSLTTGEEDTIVWNGIHHKTSAYGGIYGFPDPSYSIRVKQELKNFGIF